MSEPVVELRGIHTRFGAVTVHRDLSLSVAPGQIVGLLGGSGSGKTTLLREMLGLQRPSAEPTHLVDQGAVPVEHGASRVEEDGSRCRLHNSPAYSPRAG